MLLGEFAQELLHLDVVEEFRDVGLDDLGEMRRDHGGGVHHGITLELRLIAQRGVDPGGGQAEGRLHHVLTRQLHLPAHRVHGHELAGEDLARAGLDLLDPHHVGVGLELDVVQDAHGGHHEA